MARPLNLALVKQELGECTAEVRAIRKTCDHVIDIYTAERARIMSRDWATVHVAGDNAKSLPSWFGKR